MLSQQEVLEQSRNAFNQSHEVWVKHCEENGRLYREQGNSFQDIAFQGLGKTLLCVAYGPSTEKYMNTIIKYKDNVDVACVDKAFGKLYENGIKAKYVFLADAGISYEQWCEPFLDYTEDMVLLSNINANPKWTKNWKGKVIFYVNKDNINSEKIYSKVSGCNELIPASSNVGNAVVIFAEQVLKYDQYLLVGYDYCWRDDENYYAYHDNNKRYWMKHYVSIDQFGNLINTSGNLLFSARWLSDYVKAKLPHVRIFNCSGSGILNLGSANLEVKLSKAGQRKLTDREKQLFILNRSKSVMVNPEDGNNKLQEVLRDNNVVNVIVNFINDETIKFMEAQWTN